MQPLVAIATNATHQNIAKGGVSYDKGKRSGTEGIVPWHKSLTKAERKRLMKKAIGGFKRAGLTDDDFKELLPDDSEKSNSVRFAHRRLRLTVGRE